MTYDLATLRALPLRVHHLAAVDSTNLHAEREREAGRLFAPALVVADEQTAGQGQHGRAWLSGPGGVAATFALPPMDERPLPEVPLIAGVAVRRALARFAGGVQVKWPNDLTHGGLKLGGLLCRHVRGVTLVGVGLNVTADVGWTPDVRRRATSLADIAGDGPDKTAVLLAVAREVLALLHARPTRLADVLAELNAHHLLAGREVAVDGEPAGVVVGVEADGRLAVSDENGAVRRLHSGTVTLAG